MSPEAVPALNSASSPPSTVMSPEAVEASIQLEGVDLMVPGPRSRQVAQLTLVLDEQGEVLERRTRVWHLKRQLRSNKKLDDLVRQFETIHSAP